MNKKQRKKMNQEIFKKAMQKKQETLWNPPLPPDELAHFKETVEAYFDHFAPYKRLAAVAERGKNNSDYKSHVGGAILWKSVQPVPTASTGEALTPVIEIFLDEAPVVPDVLKGYALCQVFLELEEGPEPPSHSPGPTELEYMDGEWHVALHRDLEGLVPQDCGMALEYIPINWKACESYPDYSDDMDLIPDDIEEAFEALPRCSEMNSERIPSLLETHLGGWPAWLQGGDLEDFVLQLDGAFLGVQLGFDGQLYFGYSGSRWEMLWEIG